MLDFKGFAWWIGLALTVSLVGCGGGGGSDPDDGGAGDSDVPVDGGGIDGGGTDGGGSTDGGGTDSGPPLLDAGIPTCDVEDPGLDLGDPIDTPAGEWTFVEFPDAHCMNGESTGVGVNLNPDSDKVMIYLQGGGACFDFVSCIGVANRDGYGAGKLESWADGGGTRGIFDRDDSANPVADWNMIFVPYCTGDVHAGNNPDGDEGEHVGYVNITEYLERLVPTFSDASKVLLTGSSAGGFGAAYNYDQVQRAFGCDVPVYVVDDAGPPMSDMYMKPCLQQWWRDTWGLTDTLPDDCPECTGDDGGGIVNLATYVMGKYPNRFSLLSTMEDSVIRSFFGYAYTPSCRRAGSMPADEFRAGLNELRDDIMRPYRQFKTFYVEGDRHTFLTGPLEDTSVGGVTLAEWLRRQLEDDPAWDHVGP